MNGKPGNRAQRQIGLILAVAGLACLPALEWNPRRGAMPGVEISEAHGKIPLSFEANRGQADPQVKFIARGNGYTLFLTPGEAVLRLRNSKLGMVRLKLVGAKMSHVEGIEELPGKAHYFLGNDPQKWRTNIPTYARVRCREVYPGIDLVYYGAGQQLEYDLVVASGIDPSVIKLAFDGFQKMALNAQGDLVLLVGGAELIMRKPAVYQDMGTGRRGIASGYVLKDESQVGIQLGDYDASKPLVIDPVLVYSTFLGGSDDDQVSGIAVDEAGNAYLTGRTLSDDFPKRGGYQSVFKGGWDVFVSKVNPAGSAIVYSAYLGGAENDYGYGISVDSIGNAYITGETFSTEFPRMNPLQAVLGSSLNRQPDAFIAKIDSTGSALIYSTYLGGVQLDRAYGIAVDKTGAAYVAGETRSINFPTMNPFQPARLNHCFNDGNAPLNNVNQSEAFVTKLNPAGTSLSYSTYLGGSSMDQARGIVIDEMDNAYIVGSTSSMDFQVSPGAFQPRLAGPGVDVFVAKFSANGRNLLYSTYLGGDGTDEGRGIAVDGLGRAFVTGITRSAGFPTRDAIQHSSCGFSDVFVSKLNSTGTDLIYSTYLGGSGADESNGIAVDASGNAYVIGTTNSGNYPITQGAFKRLLSRDDAGDAFVSILGPTGAFISYSTYLGGNDLDFGNGIAVDRSGHAYVVGATYSPDFHPVTGNAMQQKLKQGLDSFLAKITFESALSPGQIFPRRCVAP